MKGLLESLHNGKLVQRALEELYIYNNLIKEC